jgi:fibronectin type 3 domain-containing protein/dihydrofolate reductase
MKLSYITMKLSHITMKLSHITLSAFKSLLIVAFLPLFLVACGGSSDSSPPSQGEKIISTLKNIELTADSTSQITLSWNAVDGASYYEIYKNTTNTTTSGLTAISSQTSTSFKSTGLTANTTYYYWGKVCKTEGSVGSTGSSTNTAGHSCTAFSPVASTTTWVVIPSIPTGVSLTADSASQITVSWTGNGAHSYEIYRNTSDSTTNLTAIATPTNASYKDTGLTADTTYYYWVKACKESSTGEEVCSDFSPVTSKTTLVVIPSIPTILSLTANSASQITVSWTGNGAHSYEVYRSTSNNTANSAKISDPTDSSYVNTTGLTPNTTYYYWVKACNANTSGKRCSDFSTVASTATWSVDSEAPPRITAPDLSADSTSQITVSWTGNNEATSYQIYRNTINSITNLAAIATPTNTSYEDTGLTADTTYYYWVKACKRNSQGRDDCSDFSQVASKTTLVVIPSAPTDLSLTADSSSQLTVSWIGNGAHSYEIYRNTSNSTAGSTAIATPSDAAYVNTELEPNTTYYYWVKACNANTSGKRCSDFSQVASKTTLVVIPSVPTGLILTVDSASQITVQWDRVAGAEYYEVYRNISDSNTSLTAIATTTNVSYEDTGLTADTNYYWVKACKRNLERVEVCSDFSTVASKTTSVIPPDVPTGVKLSADSTSQITVSWSTVSEATSYKIYRHTSDASAAAMSVATTETDSYTDTGLNPGTLYYYWIKACKENSEGGVACSNFSTVSSKATLVVIPSAPTGVSLSADSASQITVLWNSVTATNYYEVFRNTTDSNLSSTRISQPANTTYTDSGLSADTTYYYWVKACGIGDMCSAFSEVASIKTLEEEVKLGWTKATDSAAFSARYGHQAVVFNDGDSTKMWVIGGLDSRRKNDVWSSTNGITWIQATTTVVFSARYGHQAVVFDNKMWVIAGEDGDEKNDVWSTTDGITWTEVTATAAFPVREEHQAVVLNNKKIWVTGGTQGDGEGKSNVWSSADGITWKTNANSIEFSTRYGHQSVFFKNEIWVIGGYYGGDNKNDVWNSTNGITWKKTTAKAAFSARDGHQSVVFDNKMWVIGGDDEGRINDVWSSTNGITWTKDTTPTTSIFSARDGHQAVVFDNKIWVIGGSGDGRKNDVWYCAASC